MTYIGFCNSQVEPSFDMSVMSVAVVFQ